MEIDQNTAYRLGKIDAVAGILAMVREMGERAALTEIAKQLLAVDPNHPHAKWFLENHKNEKTK